MNSQTDMPKSGHGPLAATQGRLAIAVSAALVTVAGTATIAWAALGLSLAPMTESPAPATPDIARTSAAGTAFAAHTLALASAAPTVDRQVPVRLAAAEMPRLDPRTDLAAAIAAPAAPVQPVAVTLPAEVSASLRPVARPDQAAAPVRVAAAPVTRPAPAVRIPVSATPVARNRPEKDQGSRLKKIWSVGAFR
jgi:hypothetical protein